MGQLAAPTANSCMNGNEPIVNKRVKKDKIYKERDLFSVCNDVHVHNSTMSHVIPCCSMKFHMFCITDLQISTCDVRIVVEQKPKVMTHCSLLVQVSFRRLEMLS